VVGALLCTYAQSQLDDFFYKTEGLQMCSTARYIGVLDSDGKMTTQNVWFELPVDATGTAPVVEKRVEHYAIRQIGSR